MSHSENSFDSQENQKQDNVKSNIEAILARIENACIRAERHPSEIKLMAVTKLNPVAAVEAAYAAGVRFFGENRVQEAESKFPDFVGLHPDSQIHMIGHLQKNKAKKAAALFSCIQSVDSIELLDVLDRHCESAEKNLDVLFELHTGESSKTGFPDINALVSAVRTMKNRNSIRLRGLMTMAPFTNEKEIIRNSFRKLAAAFGQVRQLINTDTFDIISMGMSNDFEIAIEEGSNFLRIGTAIFQRLYK